jgi:hypothetical protein
MTVKTTLGMPLVTKKLEHVKGARISHDFVTRERRDILLHFM